MWIFTDRGLIEISKHSTDRLRLRSENVEEFYSLAREAVADPSDISVLDREEKRFSAKKYVIAKVIQHLVFQVNYEDLPVAVLEKEKVFYIRVLECIGTHRRSV